MDDKRRTIETIRAFNRFYRVQLGFLNRNYLDSGYSVTETRLLFELHQAEQVGMNRLIDMLRLDKGYISRLIRKFEQNGMATRETDPCDRRAVLVRLTAEGHQEAERLIGITNHEIYQLIRQFDPAACGELCAAMEQIIKIFSQSFQAGGVCREA